MKIELIKAQWHLTLNILDTVCIDNIEPDRWWIKIIKKNLPICIIEICREGIEWFKRMELTLVNSMVSGDSIIIKIHFNTFEQKSDEKKYINEVDQALSIHNSPQCCCLWLKQCEKIGKRLLWWSTRAFTTSTSQELKIFWLTHVTLVDIITLTNCATVIDAYLKIPQTQIMPEY